MIKQAEQESKDYFEEAIRTIYIDMDRQGAFAKVVSECGKGAYPVRIDESTAVPHATSCKCPHNRYRRMYCKHMLVVDVFYQRIYTRLSPLEEVMASAQAEMEQFDRDCDPNAYEVLAETKNASPLVQYAYSHECGHLVKEGHEGEMCGGCWQKYCS